MKRAGSEPPQTESVHHFADGLGLFTRGDRRGVCRIHAAVADAADTELSARYPPGRDGGNKTALEMKVDCGSHLVPFGCRAVGPLATRMVCCCRAGGGPAIAVRSSHGAALSAKKMPTQRDRRKPNPGAASRWPARPEGFSHWSQAVGRQAGRGQTLPPGSCSSTGVSPGLHTARGQHGAARGAARNIR